jgi:phenylacetic acid degradation operon negative regulatory protein
VEDGSVPPESDSAAPIRGIRDIAVDFPRPQKGGNSQHLLVTMLAEFWRHTDRWLPARAILRLAADLGLTRSAATTALSRLTGRGVLENNGAGRNSGYRFAAASRARIQVGFEQISAFGDPSQPWDRRWTVIAFTIPETAREVRELFRARLRWLGFAPAYGALWVSPQDRLEATEQICEAFGLEDYMLFRMEDSDRKGKHPVTAWQLDDAPEHYGRFISEYSSWLEKLKSGVVEPAEAFRVRVEAMDQWRAFPWDDPGLPHELLPAGWPLAKARAVFLHIHADLTDLAAGHIRQALEETAPEAVPEIRMEIVEAGG